MPEKDRISIFAAYAAVACNGNGSNRIVCVAQLPGEDAREIAAVP